MPFKVLRVVNPVSYESMLPQDSKIHQAFHVSQMHQALSPGTSTSTELHVPSSAELIPVEINNIRWRQTPSGRYERWSDSALLDTTWEDALSLKNCFPHLPAWGQVESQGEGDVSVASDDVVANNKTAAMAAKPESATMARKRAMLADNQAKWTNQGEECVIARPARIKQPNHKFVDPEWINSP